MILELTTQIKRLNLTKINEKKKKKCRQNK